MRESGDTPEAIERIVIMLGIKRGNLLLCFTGILLVFTCYVPILKYLMRSLMLVVTLYALLFLLYKLPRFYMSRFFWIPVAFFVYRFFIAWVWGHYDMGNSLSTGVYVLLAEVLGLIVASGLFLALVSSGDYKCFRTFIYISIGFLLLFAIFTIRAEVGTARDFGSTDGSYYAMQRAADNIMTGTLDYATIHTLPFVIFGLIYSAKSMQVKGKAYFYIGGLLMLLAVYRSAFTLATLFALVLLIIAFVPQRRIAVSLIGIGFLLVLFGVFLKVGLVTEMLMGFRSLISESDSVSITGKVDELISLSKGVAIGDGATRLDLYTLSLKSFCKSPLWGNFDAELGGHAFLLDYLGREGLLGVAIWCLFYVNYFLKIKAVLSKSLRTPYVVAFVSFIGIISLKAAWMRTYGFALYLIVPSLLLIQEKLYYETSYRVRRYLRLPVRMFAR